MFFLTLDHEEDAKLSAHLANSVLSIAFRYCVQIQKAPKSFKIPRTKYHQLANVIYVSVIFNSEGQVGRPTINLDQHPHLSNAGFVTSLIDPRVSLLVILLVCLYLILSRDILIVPISCQYIQKNFGNHYWMPLFPMKQLAASIFGKVNIKLEILLGFVWRGASFITLMKLPSELKIASLII